MLNESEVIQAICDDEEVRALHLHQNSKPDADRLKGALEAIGKCRGKTIGEIMQIDHYLATGLVSSERELAYWQAYEGQIVEIFLVGNAARILTRQPVVMHERVDRSIEPNVRNVHLMKAATILDIDYAYSGPPVDL